MKVRFALLGVIIIMQQIACTKPADIKLPEHTPRLVLHSYTSAGDTFRVALGRTFQTPELVPEDETYVTDGWVVLYENNIFFDSLEYRDDEKRYVSDKIAEAGKLYSVRAGAAGFETIDADCAAPLPVPTISVNWNRAVRSTSFGQVLDDVKFTISDPAAASNFYITRVETVGSFGLFCLYTYDAAIERSSVTLAPFERNNCIENALQYNDRTFNGSQKEISFSGASEAFEPYTGPNGEILRPYLQRYHISEDHYRYFRMAYDQGLLLEEGPVFLNPRMIRGNVRKGYGLFSVYAVVTDTIR